MNALIWYLVALVVWTVGWEVFIKPVAKAGLRLVRREASDKVEKIDRTDL